MHKYLMILATIAAAFSAGGASAEILAMMSYESKPAEELKSLKLSGAEERREGIAIIDVDPESATFGKWLADIPLDPTGVAHHIFFDRTMTKAYVTSLATPALQVMDMTAFPPRLTAIDVPNCAMAEDVIFDEANENWYLTCMNSSNVWRGRVSDDAVTGEINLPDMRDGSVTVIDLQKGEAVASVDTLKDAGFNPNVIVLLPEWNDFAGH